MSFVADRACRPEEKLFWSAEPFSLGVRAGSYHLHALIETRQSSSQVETWWRKWYGIAKVRRYDSKMGAVRYVSKYMTKAMHDYDLMTGTSRNYKFRL
jgi:hypothetical protein